MGNSLRCCLSCLIPCGSLDLIRIVHLNGVVEVITRPITAGEVLAKYPSYVLTKPSSEGVVRRIVILSSSSELKRGGIYFLIPASSVPESTRKVRVEREGKVVRVKAVAGGAVAVSGGGGVEKKGRERGRRSVDGGEWRPHLESICEEQ